MKCCTLTCPGTAILLLSSLLAGLTSVIKASSSLPKAIVSDLSPTTLGSAFSQYQNILVRRSPKCTKGSTGPKCGLLVYMHGIHMTPGSMDYLLLGSNPGDRTVDLDSDKPMVVILPKSLGAPWDYNPNGGDSLLIGALLDYALANLNVDVDRMYIGGYSSGSLESWAIAKGPLGHRLAGIIPYGCIFDAVGMSSTAGRYNLHILYTHGALDKICGYGGDIRNNWRSVGARKQVLDIAESRKYPVGAREKMCATECDIYVHCFQHKESGNTWFGCDPATGKISMPVWAGNGLYSPDLPKRCTDTAKLNECRVCFPESKCGDPGGDSGYESSPASLTPTLQPRKGGPIKLNDYGRLSGSKCGVVRLNAMLGQNHDFPERLSGASQYASPSAMFLEALRFIWAQKRSHDKWCYGGGRDDSRGICVDNPEYFWLDNKVRYDCAHWVTQSYRCHENELKAACPASCKACTHDKNKAPSALSNPTAQPAVTNKKETQTSSITTKPTQLAVTTKPPQVCDQSKCASPNGQGGYDCWAVGVDGDPYKCFGEYKVVLTGEKAKYNHQGTIYDIAEFDCCITASKAPVCDDNKCASPDGKGGYDCWAVGVEADPYKCFGDYKPVLTGAKGDFEYQGTVYDIAEFDCCIDPITTTPITTKSVTTATTPPTTTTPVTTTQKTTTTTSINTDPTTTEPTSTGLTTTKLMTMEPTTTTLTVEPMTEYTNGSEGDKYDTADKPVPGGLRIRSPHSTIEMGDDVKLFRSGPNALTVDAAVDIKGEVDTKSIFIGGVSLKEYINKIAETLLKSKED